MRARKTGKILNFSSIAAFNTAAGSAFYGSTKAGLEALSDGLRKEVGPLGIDVMVIEPGPFKTDFAGRSLDIAKTNIDDYKDTAGKRKERNDPHTEWHLGDPDKAADLLVELSEKETLPFRLLLGSDAINIAKNHFKEREAELEKWQEYSLRTDF